MIQPLAWSPPKDSLSLLRKWGVMRKWVLAIVLVFMATHASAFQVKKLAKFKALNICMKCDLSMADLPFANLNGANLRGADLSRTNLSGTSLKHAKLEGAILCQTFMLWGIEKPECNLQATNHRLSDVSVCILHNSIAVLPSLRGGSPGLKLKWAIKFVV